MTDKEKAKAYDEALKAAQCWLNAPQIIQECNYTIEDAIQNIFPQLRESEDERIRKTLIEELSACNTVGELKFRLPAPTREECIAWLEKQKEQPTVAKSERVIRAARSVLNNWLDGTDCPDVSGDFAELEYAIREYDGEEKAKEQDNEEGDFTIYHPQKNGEGKYECIPFSFYGSLTSFSNDKDLMDFLNESFYDKKECEEWCERENKPELPDCKHKIKKDSVFDYLCDNEKQKEQKPAQTSEEKEYIRTLKSLISDFIRDMRPKDVAFYQKMYDWLEERHVEQKPAEWSEEDERKRLACIATINDVIDYERERWEDYNPGKPYRPITKYDEQVDWLKSLRPSWKPSEEQMEALKKAVNNLADTEVADSVRLSIMYDHLKELM